jgi:hypothetical protein
MYLVFSVFISRLTFLPALIKVSIDSHHLLLGDNIEILPCILVTRQQHVLSFPCFYF